MKHKRQTVKFLLEQVRLEANIPYPRDYVVVLLEYRPYMGRILQARIDEAVSSLRLMY